MNTESSRKEKNPRSNQGLLDYDQVLKVINATQTWDRGIMCDFIRSLLDRNTAKHLRMQTEEMVVDDESVLGGDSSSRSRQNVMRISVD